MKRSTFTNIFLTSMFVIFAALFCTIFILLVTTEIQERIDVQHATDQMQIVAPEKTTMEEGRDQRTMTTILVFSALISGTAYFLAKKCE